MSASLSVITQGGLGFYTVPGGVDPGDLRFQSQIVRVVEIWKEFRSKDETLSSPGARDLDIGQGGSCCRAVGP